MWMVLGRFSKSYFAEFGLPKLVTLEDETELLVEREKDNHRYDSSLSWSVCYNEFEYVRVT